MNRPSDCGSAAELDFDPAAVLARDSRVLLDPHFLGPLHEELVNELAPREATSALLQMGFLHGLQDAVLATASAAEMRNGMAAPIVPPVQLRFHTVPGEGPHSALELHGSWPECAEASAHLSYVGQPEGPVCALTAGYASGWLSGLFDADLLAVETECAANGHGSCRFVAREAAVWRSGDDPRARDRLEALSFATLRELVREQTRNATAPSPYEMSAPLGRDAAAVHIWGPVMVVPYAGPEELLRAIDLIGNDEGAAEVSVVVLDLADAMIDEAFGALALEQAVQTIEAWGAEAIFAEPSPLCGPVISDLEHAPLLVLKNLDEAIAAAFQIARSQARLV